MMKTMVEHFQNILDNTPFFRMKDDKVIRVKSGYAENTLQTNTTEYCNIRGDVHGAVCTGLADGVMGIACFTLGKNVSTIDINGNYVRAVKGGEKLRGVGIVEHNGTRTMVATSRIYNEKGELVHVGRGTFYVLHNMELPDLPWSIIPEDTIE